MNIYATQKQTHRHREQTSGYQKEEGRGKDKLGVWDYHKQTIMYKINKQQGYIIQYGELQPISYNNLY